MTNDIGKIFKNLRNEFIIIGLTGAVGSGCTTSAAFLNQDNDNNDIEGILNCHPKNEFDLEYRKLLRVKQFYNDNKWEPFYHIRVSDLLFLVLVFHINDEDSMPKIGELIQDESMEEDIKAIFKSTSFTALKVLSQKYIDAVKEYTSTKESMATILENIALIVKKDIDKKNKTYTPLFQSLGKNIRKNDSIFCSKEDMKDLHKTLGFNNYNDLPIFIIPELIRRTIKVLQNNDKKHFFTIDAFRNTYEIEFFRNRYQSFYLFSILASEEQREQRILNDFHLKREDYENIKKFETNDDNIESQAINACIGKGDVFINNDSHCISKTSFYLQLLKYVALIRKPGLFTPTDDERFMQVAFTARYSSGCISRQVGAAVTGKDGYLRGFGWNDVPEKHISCLYRTPQQLLGCSDNLIFSTYERSEKFYSHILQTKNTLTENLPFCFKDQQNTIELNEKIDSIGKKIQSKVSKEDIKDILLKSKLKNPTRERALHAEENAFLQISKSGGQSVVGGTLYSTDSPCQLCSKKSMQLKIKRIVYIDAYPDISEKHTLKSGPEEQWPKFEMFSGAIGSAYFKLYVPMVGIKDEIKMLS